MNRSSNILRFVLFAAVILVVQSSLGAPRASEILTKLAASFGSMPSYGVAFSLTADDFSTSGHYNVKGESYYMLLGQAEVYSDGKLRYEVDNSRREVTITSVDLTSRNLINNPVHAFDFIGAQYTPELISEQNNRAILRLTSTDQKNDLVSVISLQVDTDKMLPESLSYQLDGQTIKLAIRSIETLASPIKSFSKSQYAGYEFIDFR